MISEHYSHQFRHHRVLKGLYLHHFRTYITINYGPCFKIKMFAITTDISIVTEDPGYGHGDKTKTGLMKTVRNIF